MTEVLISLGSNIEPRRLTIEKAIDILSKEILSDVHVSHFYETEPVGYTEQASFINVCVAASTNATAQQFKSVCSDVEQRLGRQHREKWHEREIDIDIILFGSAVIDEAELTIPHPRFRDRAFVLVPAAEIAPDEIDPVTGDTIAQLLRSCTDSASVVVVDSSVARRL